MKIIRDSISPLKIKILER